MAYPFPEDFDRCFPAQREKPIKEGAFELGLCLGGTVSAGAYTGGVLDLLIEALDAWTRAKEDKSPDAPPHEVVISTLAGTSGGAINGAIVLRAAGWEFDHGSVDSNPFYAAWTAGVDLMKLLGPAANESELVSVFNSQPLDDQAKTTISKSGRTLGSSPISPHRRSYLGDPLRLIAMVGNVTGIPYSIAMGGESRLSHDLVAHNDWVQFALTVPGGAKAAPEHRGDEIALGSQAELNWNMLADAALATSAFPLAFRSRQLSRRMQNCAYRAAWIPGEAGPGSGKVVPLVPKWETLEAGLNNPDTYDFINVDGGTINNEPLDMVRIALAGVDGRNKRSAKEADRAVILIDPFSDPEALGPRMPPALAGLVMPFIMSLVYQARYKPEDIALAYDEGAFSRYLIAPVGRSGPDGQPTIGKAAIASGGLGGFLGFVDTAFLRYDYALGRLNAYSFLKRHLALPENDNNPIFASWTSYHRNKYRFTESGIDYLPLIPIMDAVPVPTREALPSWPVIADLPAGLDAAISARLNAVFALAKAQAAPESWWKSALQSTALTLAWSLIRPRIRAYAMDTLRRGLQEQKLMPQA